MLYCKICITESAETVIISGVFCHSHLNVWQAMRAAIQARLQAEHGAPTRENLPIMDREMKRLTKLWKRDRVKFHQEAATWY